MSNNLINFVSQRRLKTFLDKLFGVFISKAEYSNNMTHYDNRHTCYYNPTNLDFSKNYVMLCEDITSPEDIANSVWTANYNNEVFEFSPEIISEFSWLENYQCYFCTFKTPLNYKIDDPDKLIELQCLVFPKPYQSITEPGIYITTENLSSYAIINSEIEFSIGELKQIDDKYIPNTVIRSSEKGLPNGVATLNDNGKINIDQLPDDIGLGDGLNEVDWETNVINKPFYEEGIKITFNGEIEDALDCVALEEAELIFYKVSTEQISSRDIIGLPFVFNDGSTNGMSMFVEEGFVVPVDSGNANSYLVVANGVLPILFNVAEAETVSVMGVSIPFPSTGIWFASMNGSYTSSLEKDYSVKQIDSKYIPTDLVLNNYYNKTEINDIVSNANAVLDDYYKKSEVYNKEELLKKLTDYAYSMSDIDNMFVSLDTAISNIVGSGVLS